MKLKLNINGYKITYPRADAYLFIYFFYCSNIVKQIDKIHKIETFFFIKRI